MPKISIIIPCFNHGQYLPEALQSVEQCENKELYEIIIINDGSTDVYTIKVLNKLKQEGYFVVDQSNQGLSAARNHAIRLAKGEYILPLDSDNRIRPAYITEPIKILDRDPSVSIVYGNAWHFGDENRLFDVGPFNQQLLMIGNYIDACAVFRKSMCDDLGGYDEQMLIGLEDWEFWLRASFKGYKFYYIPEILFDYRVLGNSMLRSLNREKMKILHEYVFKKHSLEYYEQFREYYHRHMYLFETKWYKRPFKAILYALGLHRPVIKPSFLKDQIENIGAK